MHSVGTQKALQLLTATTLPVATSRYAVITTIAQEAAILLLSAHLSGGSQQTGLIGPSVLIPYLSVNNTSTFTDNS